MTESNRRALIQAWVFGKLSAEEQAELMRQALDEDQSLFDELMEANDDRLLMREAIYRNRLKRSLAKTEPQPWWQSGWAWLNRPATRLTLAGAMALVFGVLVWQWHTPKERVTIEPANIVTSASTDLSAYFALPLRNQLGIQVTLNRDPAEYHLGDVVRATVQLREAAAVFVLRREADGRARMVFPQDFLTSAELPAGNTEIAFDPVPPTTDVTVRQQVQMWIIAVPPRRDLRREPIDWGKLAAYSVQKVTYDIAP